MAAEEKDHYDVLGVLPTASNDEVKKAYRSLSRQFHPDKAGPHVDEADKRAHERRMIALNIAYQVLMSPRERRAYDLSREGPSWPTQQTKMAGAYAAAAAAVASRRAASWGRHPSRSSAPPRQPAPPTSGTSAPPAGESSARGSSAEPTGAWSCGKATFSTAGHVPKPRYQTGGKYSQRARQARRMDPSQYTTHIDGRAHEFDGSSVASNAGTGIPGCVSGAPLASDASSWAPGAPKNPAWLQKQLDLAREWEEAHVPTDPVEEKYQWRKASDNWLRNIRERKSAREQLGEEQETAPL